MVCYFPGKYKYVGSELWGSFFPSYVKVNWKCWGSFDCWLQKNKLFEDYTMCSRIAFHWFHCQNWTSHSSAWPCPSPATPQTSRLNIRNRIYKMQLLQKPWLPSAPNFTLLDHNQHNCLTALVLPYNDNCRSSPHVDLLGRLTAVD